MRHSRLLILIGTIIFALFSTSNCGAEVVTELSPGIIRIEERQKEIENLLKENKFKEVEEILSDAIRRNIRTKTGSYYAAALSERLAENGGEKYLDALNRWIEASPKSSIPLSLRARYYFAIAYQARGSTFNDKVPEKAMALYSERLKKSHADTTAALALDPKDPLALWSMVSLTRDVPTLRPLQKEFFDRAIGVAPDFAQVYYDRAISFSPKWGGSEKEIEEFVSASLIEAGPESNLPWLRYIAMTEICDLYGGKKKYLQSGGHWPDLERNFNLLVERFPESGIYAAVYAEVAFLLEEHETAKKMLDIAHQREPNNPDVQEIYGKLASQLSLSKKEYQARAYQVKGLIDEASRAQLRGNYGEAQKIYEKIVKLDPAEHKTWLGLAYTLERQQKYGDAKTAYDEALKLSPRNPSYLVKRCNVKILMNKPDDAIVDCTAALRHDAGLKQAYLNRARAYELLGKTSEAKNDQDLAASLPEKRS